MQKNGGGKKAGKNRYRLPAIDVYMHICAQDISNITYAKKKKEKMKKKG